MSGEEKKLNQKLKLYVKGSNFHGQAKKRFGDNFKCQQILLIMRLKNVDFEIIYIDERHKQRDEDWKNLCATMTPVLVDHDVEYQDGDEIVSHLEKHYSPKLSTSSVNAESLANIATPISSLVGWLKNKDPNKNAKLFSKLRTTLKEIDDELGSEEGLFLVGDELKLPDCILLPKLYHAKVAMQHCAGYDFTKDFPHIGRYLKNALDNEVFKSTCPGEDEIEEKWKDCKGNVWKIKA